MGILALDDTDSSIQYSVGWNKAGSALEYNKTTTWTVVAGATAKVPFRGTSIGVYGTISPKTRISIAPRSVYSIDGGALTGFTAVQDNKAQYSQLFFQSPTLPDGAHVLTVTNALVSDPLFLDFLLVSQTTDTPGTLSGLPLPSASSSSNSSVSLTSSTSSLSSTTSSTSSTITSTPAPVTITITSMGPSSTMNSADAAKASGDTVGGARKSNAGAVVGGVIGAVAILLAFAFGFVYYNRKRLQRQRRESLMEYQSSGPSASYWNRPLATAATPHSDQTSSSPPPPPPHMSQNYAPSAVSNTASSGYGQPQPRYPGGYAPGNEYYNDSSDLAYAVNPTPAQGYTPPSQLVNQGQGQAGYGYGNEYNRAGSGVPYSSQGGYGYDNGSMGERVRVRLD